jgi:hypothetical protein
MKVDSSLRVPVNFGHGGRFMHREFTRLSSLILSGS